MSVDRNGMNIRKSGKLSKISQKILGKIREFCPEIAVATLVHCCAFIPFLDSFSRLLSLLPNTTLLLNMSLCFIATTGSTY